MRISGGLLLFKNYDGTPLVSRRKLLRFGNSLDRRVFLGVIDDFDVVLFSSNPKEKSSAVRVVFLPTSKTKILGHGPPVFGRVFTDFPFPASFFLTLSQE